MKTPGNILIASDKFKGSLDASEACAAIAAGLRRRFPDAVIHIRPIADGGEGFAASLETTLAGTWVEAPSHDPLGRPVTARYLLAHTPDGPLAVMEMAEASGMWRISSNERDIMRASTFGTGEIMRHAVIHNGAKRIVIGIGGSATNDAGAGMAAALGVAFLDPQGSVLNPHPDGLLDRLSSIDTRDLISLPPVTVACDVNSPLLGPAGATRVFGPQKGADDATMQLLERVLQSIVAASDGAAMAAIPGAGAAGGLGFGLLRFAGASLVPGFELLADLTGLEAAIASADLVITGEGSLDSQSLAGKGPVGITRLARKHNKTVVGFCGKTDETLRASGHFDSVTALADTGLPVEILMSQAASLLESAAAGFQAPLS